jgi:hypothetical protein
LLDLGFLTRTPGSAILSEGLRFGRSDTLYTLDDKGVHPPRLIVLVLS